MLQEKFINYSLKIFKNIKIFKIFSQTYSIISFQAETGRMVKTVKMEETAEMEERVPRDLEDLRDHEVWPGRWAQASEIN